MKKMHPPSITDFPASTVFIIKEFDLPLSYSVVDGKEQWLNWFGGTPTPYDVSALKVDNNWPAQSFDEWVALVADSIKR